MISAVPSTAIHCQPARHETLICERALRLPSFAGPYVTNATTSSPVKGWAMTPAFTNAVWIVPSARTVDTIARYLSFWASATTSASVLMRESLPVDAVVRSAIGAIGNRDWGTLRPLLHPYMRWTCPDGWTIRGRSQVLTFLVDRHGIGPPVSHELRDGQIYRWVEDQMSGARETPP